jgi:hypothetical protein
MAKISFSFEGLDELAEDISKCVKDYPDQTEKEVYRLAGKFTKDVNEKMPGSYASGKWPIPSSWHRSRTSGWGGGGYSVSVEIQNTAPHWHLIENGHRVVADPKMYAAFKAYRLDHSKSHRKSRKSGNTQVLGFAPGRHYCENTRREWDSKFPAQLSPFLDKMLRGHNL